MENSDLAMILDGAQLWYTPEARYVVRNGKNVSIFFLSDNNIS